MSKIVGIDLGTTYSLVADDKEIVVGLTDSAVDLETKSSANRHMQKESVISSYKTNMGLGETGQLPIDCSAVTLKYLNDKYEAVKGYRFTDAIISVPAYYSTSQREAVAIAAEKAGINLRGLVNEPTAAALLVSKGIQDLVVVFDLGGGTFDVSIIDSRAGYSAVLATDGMVIGGDDLDNYLVDLAFKECKVRMINRSADKRKYLKSQMVLAKEKIQKTRDTVYVPMSGISNVEFFELTPEKYREAVKEVFGETINKTKYIVHANIPQVECPKMVYVGGSTVDPYLKELLREEMDFQELKTDINPNTAVALGAGRYAKMVEDGTVATEVEDITKQLGIQTNVGTMLTIIEAGTIVPCTNRIVVDNPVKAEVLNLNLYQGNDIIAVNNDYIGQLQYDYGRMMEAEEGIVEVTVSVSMDGIITLTAMDPLLDDEPQSIKLQRR